MIILVLIVSVLNYAVCLEIVGVDYSFNANFAKDFNDQGCVNKERWYLVNYEKIGVTPPYEEATTAIRTSKNSCVTSFPIILLPESTLEIIVFTNIISVTSGLAVLVSNEDGNPLFKYVFGLFNKNFVDGWCVITIPIQKTGKGYITFLGHSSKSEIVLINSFRYVTKTDDTNDEIEYFSRNLIKHTPNEDIEGSSEDFEDVGSGGDAGDGFVTNEPESPSEELVIDTELELWSILLIALVILILIILLAIASYQYGKMKSENEDRPVLRHGAGETTTVTIPRVRVFE